MIVATLLCWGILAVENGAEQVDSGWAVSTPVATGASVADRGMVIRMKSGSETPATVIGIATAPKHPDPQQQMVLRHVLEQTQVPLLRNTPSPQAASEDNDKTSAGGSRSWRFAVRPDGIEGWRPAGQGFPSAVEAWQSGIESPQVAATNPAATPGDSAALPTTTTGAQSTSEPPIENPAASGSSFPHLHAANDELSKPSVNEPAVEENTAEPSVQQPIETAPSDNVDAEIEPLSAEPPETVVPSQIRPPLTKQLVALRSRVRSVLKGYYRKNLNSRDNDPWEVMHGMLAYGVHSRIRQGSSRGEPVTSVGWLCYNKPCKGQTLMYVTPKGELRAKYGVGLQGHLGQLLAMLAQCHVSADYPIRVGQKEFTIHDLIEAEKKTCYPKSELTFKLIALQYYLDLNDKWVNDQGLEWDIPRLIREELAQPIRGAACGGTHRLSGLSLTVKARVRRGEPLDGEYARAAEFVKKYHQYAFKLQNRDGSLSTAWFQGSGDERDIDRRIKTTGHILEWLCYSLSDEELRQPQTVRAVTYLANLMYSNYDREWEVGPMCHATHALLLYDERVFQPFDGSKYEVAYKPKPAAVKTSPALNRR